jgi:hypothetical protein
LLIRAMAFHKKNNIHPGWKWKMCDYEL